MTPLDWLHVGLDAGLIGAVWVFGHDLLQVEKRVVTVEKGNDREDADERVLHGETQQLREELDDIHLALKNLARAMPKDDLTTWDESGHLTIERIAPPSSRPGATIEHALSPHTPLLPRWAVNTYVSCSVCGLESHCCICGGPVP